jgi:hypothetical protein
LNKETLKNQLLSNIDAIVNIIADGNTAEIKKNKDGILILEVFRKKIKNSID